VKATVEFPGAFQSSVTSHPVHVWLVANPNPPGEIVPTQLNLQYESTDLGVSRLTPVGCLLPCNVR
jgi:hypothetical protein